MRAIWRSSAGYGEMYTHYIPEFGADGDERSCVKLSQWTHWRLVIEIDLVVLREQSR